MITRPLSIGLVSREYPAETGYGGIGTYYADLAKALVERGHTVVVLSETFGRDSYQNDSGIHVYRVRARFNVSRVPLIWRLNKYWRGYRLTIALMLRQLVKKHKLDLIETPELWAEPFLYSLLPAHRPLVVRLHSGTALGLKYNQAVLNPQFRVNLRLEKWLVARAAQVTAPSSALVEASRTVGFSLPGARCRVIGNPVDVALFQPLPETSLDQSSPLIFFAGRPEPWKGVDLFIAAIPTVLAAYPAAQFMLVGLTDETRSVVDGLVKKLPEAAQAQVIGRDKVPRQTLPALYQQAAVVVVPSRWEGFGYVCAEAMACARPVIAARVGGLAEMIEDGVSGVLFTSGDAAELAAAINRLLGDAALRQELGSRARQAVVARFATDIVVEQLIATYQALVFKRVRP